LRKPQSEVSIQWKQRWNSHVFLDEGERGGGEEKIRGGAIWRDKPIKEKSPNSNLTGH